MISVTVPQGEAVHVRLAETDGEFTISYGAPHLGVDTLLIHADMPDSSGREGIIYEEKYGLPDHGDVDCQKPEPRTPQPMQVVETEDYKAIANELFDIAYRMMNKLGAAKIGDTEVRECAELLDRYEAILKDK